VFFELFGSILLAYEHLMQMVDIVIIYMTIAD